MEEEEKGLRVEEMEMRAERTRQGLRRTKQVLLDREKMQRETESSQFGITVAMPWLSRA